MFIFLLIFFSGNFTIVKTTLENGKLSWIVSNQLRTGEHSDCRSVFVGVMISQLSSVQNALLVDDSSGKFWYYTNVGPPNVLSLFIDPSNYSCNCHEPHLLELCEETWLSNGRPTSYSNILGCHNP